MERFPRIPKFTRDGDEIDCKEWLNIARKHGKQINDFFHKGLYFHKEAMSSGIVLI